MDAEKGHFDRSTVAQYVGTVLFIVLLETHVVSRPLAFLLGPWIICLCLFVAAPSNFLARWRRIVLIAGVASGLAFLLMRYVFA
jgi:hypothetical protein